MENNMNNNRGQNNNMTRNENVKGNGKVRNIAIAAAGVAALALGGFFVVKKIRAKKQGKTQQAAEKDAE